MKKTTNITRNSNRYPKLLKETASPPGQLFIKGELREDIPLVAIVGSRKPTGYGREITRRLAYDLADSGVGIVSGLAYGIDAIAHKAALEASGYTIAVMASGLDRIYPAVNRSLAENITQNGGALISEYEKGVPPLRQHFPARNRIVAGLCLAAIITEAAERSGSLITANFALENNREVLAVPGNITSRLSTGTNNLIKAGATAITSAEDALTAIGLERAGSTAKSKTAQNAEEALILKLLSGGQTNIDHLIEQSGWDVATFNRTITLMEISGKIRRIDSSNIVAL